MQWKPPGASAFSDIPTAQLTRLVSCPLGCSGRGCCVDDGVCSCNPGYGGAKCEIVLSACGAPDAPSGSVIQGGIAGRYFTDNAWTTVGVSRNVDAQIFVSWGGAPLSVGGYYLFVCLFVYLLVGCLFCLFCLFVC